MGILDKLFKKKKYNNKMIEMAEKVKEENIYVWQKSERIGKIVVEKEIKEGWMYFTDGSRINSKLINEFLSKATNMKEAEETSAILSGASPENIKKAESGEKVTQAEAPTVTIKSQNNSQSNDVFDEDSLMVGILEKLSKKNKTNLDVSVGIHLPSKTIFKALQQDVDDDELRRGLEKLVKKQINNIEEQLNNQVEQFIQNYYYEQTRKKKSV